MHVGIACAISVVLTDGMSCHRYDCLWTSYTAVTHFPGAVAALMMILMHAAFACSRSSVSGQAVLTMRLWRQCAIWFGISRCCSYCLPDRWRTDGPDCAYERRFALAVLLCGRCGIFTVAAICCSWRPVGWTGWSSRGSGWQDEARRARIQPYLSINFPEARAPPVVLAIQRWIASLATFLIPFFEGFQHIALMP